MSMKRPSLLSACRILIATFLLCSVAFPAAPEVAPAQGRFQVVAEYTTKAKTNWYTDTWASPIATVNNQTWFVYVDPHSNPHVGQVINGKVTDLSVEAGYACTDDGHNEFSLGVDNDGFIHVLGNMHNNELRYWVSNKTYDITGGFKRRFGAIPGSFSYYHFFRNPAGELFMSARVQTRNAMQLSHGARGVGLFRYSTKTRTWERRGALAPCNDARYPVIFWNPTGHKKSGYQMYKSDLLFDRKGRLHFTSQVDNHQAEKTDNYVVYAYSDDQGRTFRRGDGSLITLPMNITKDASRPDVLEGSKETQLAERSGLLLDAENRPGVFYFTEKALWLRVLNGTHWEARKQLMTNRGDRAIGLSDAQGTMTITTKNHILIRLTGFDATPEFLHLTPEITHWDRGAKDLDKRLRGFEWNSTTGDFTLYRIEIAPAPAVSPDRP